MRCRYSAKLDSVAMLSYEQAKVREYLETQAFLN